MQVLMVEDNENDFLLVKRLVAPIGDFSIVWRDSMAAGLAYIESNPVDVLLLDMALPDSNGLSALNQVQKQFPVLPIIILSGNSADELALEAVRQGAQDYLVKGKIDGQILGKSLRYAIERKRLEDRLRESEELYRTFASNFPNGGLVLYDHNLRYLLVDGLGLAELGLSKALMEGKTLWEVFPPDLAAEAEPRLRVALAGETVSQEVVYANQTLLVRYAPVRDSNGSIILGMMMSQNITRQKQAEEEFRSAFNYAAIGKAIVALDGRWLQVNKALSEIIGYSEQELLTKTFQDITHPDDLDTDLNYVRQLLAGEIQTYQMEKRYFHKLGHLVWVLLSVSLVRSSDGQPLRFISQIQNITERKQAEAALTRRLEEEQEFQGYLKALHEITIELTNIDNLDDFYKRVVELGLQRLGFDRLGLLLYDPKQAVAVGTYGTDKAGRLAAEHHIRLNPAELTRILMRALQDEARFAFDEEADLFSNFEPIGRGWNAAAVLWNGTEKLGWLATDNGVQHKAVRQAQLNILGLYALTLGSLLAEKRTKAAVQESERRLKLLAQNSPDIIYILSLDEQQVTYLNRAAFLGYSQSEIQASGSLLEAVHPNDKEGVAAHWRGVTANKESNGESSLEYRLQDHAGQWHWIQSRETVFASILGGKPTELLVTLTDITERKQAEENLTHERDLLRTVIDSFPDYIFLKDADGRFIVSNIAHAQAANLTSEALIGKTAADVFPPELAAQFQADDDRVMQLGEAIINLERETVGQHGEPKTVLTSKIPLRDSDGQIVSLVGISRDITERKQLEAQTVELGAERERVRVLRRFIHDMSHDFRTPLTVVSSSLYLLIRNKDPEKQQALAKRVEVQILRMDKLLEELLQMEYLDEGVTPFQFTSTELNAYLPPIIRDYESLMADKQITATFVPDTNPCLARIDIVEFARALTKLLDNAINYTPQGGSITIRTHMQGNWVAITIEDTGIGITKNDLTHIFERFYRADEARSTQTGGSGLGLPIVRKIVEAHQGSIEVKSDLGQGSKFSIKLPAG